MSLKYSDNDISELISDIIQTWTVVGGSHLIMDIAGGRAGVVMS